MPKGTCLRLTEVFGEHSLAFFKTSLSMTNMARGHLKMLLKFYSSMTHRSKIVIEIDVTVIASQCRWTNGIVRKRCDIRSYSFAYHILVDRPVLYILSLYFVRYDWHCSKSWFTIIDDDLLVFCQARLSALSVMGGGGVIVAVDEPTNLAQKATSKNIYKFL